MQSSHDYFYEMVVPEEMETLEYLPTFPEMLKCIGEKYSEYPAISNKETTYSYAELVDHVAKRRDFLYSQGVKKGDHIGVMCRNDLDAMELLLAIPSAGAVVQMLPNALKAEQLFGISKKFDMTAMFVSEEFMPLAEKLDCKVWPTSSMGEKAADYADVDKKDVACIFFTGGTTGAPKGAQLTQGGMMRGSFNGVFQPGKVLHGRYIAMLPLSHIFGAVAGFLSALYTGSCIYTCTDMRAAIGDIPVVKPTTLVIVPGLVDIIFNIAKMRGVGFLGGLHSIMCGAAPVPPRLMEQAREWGILMHAGYGLTEGANLTSGNCNTELRPHSMGRIYPEQEYKVVEGELWIRGDNVMVGYYKDPEKTAEVLTEDGWLRTGDLVEFDGEGFVTITGRIKNLIILANGENVSPEEIEDLLNGQPGIRDALCKEMEVNGNTVVGVEVLPFAEGKTPEEIDAMVKKAVDTVNEGLPQFKRIMKYTVRTEDFPRTGAMKIQR